jgi:hypothetical protein
LDDSDQRSFDERALWASLALELLAKAALARVSPLLIATPTEDGRNLLIASGLVSGDAAFNTVTARTLYKRCGWAFRPFDSDEAEQISRARNEYLHSAGVGYIIPDFAWWPRFWGQASILIHALDKTLEDFVGADRLADVEARLEQNQRNLEDRYETLMERAVQRLAQYKSGTLPARIADEWKRASLGLGLPHSEGHECPACGDLGWLEGEDVIEVEPRYERVGSDDYDVWVDLTVATDYFSCETCHLVLDSYELIEKAGLPLEFSDEGDMADYYEPDYGND